MRSAFWLPLLVLILAGCTEREYDLELTPAGDSLDRTLTMRRRLTSESEVPDDELKRLGREYDVEPPSPAKKNTFRFQGRFAGRMPEDVGGYGTFKRWDTSLGSASVYIERFRGNDDAAGELKQRQIAADRMVELLVGWLETELSNNPQWPALRRAINESIPRDLYNLSIYAWTLGLNAPAKELDPTVVRAAQYLVERGYLAYDDLPVILRAMHDGDEFQAEQALVWFKRVITSRLPADVPPPQFDFLATPERAWSSLVGYLETTAEYAEVRQAWEKMGMGDPKPEPSEVVIKLFWRIFPAILPTNGDDASVVLKTDYPLILTNGSWSAESGRVRWPKQRIPKADSPPALVYAVWDEPNQAAQRKHFGTIVLAGWALAEYCLWHRSLNDQEWREWDAFIERLRPGRELSDKLKEFRFRHEANLPEGKRSLSARIAELIVSELNRGS